jgi:hypothetical protein
MGENMPDDTVIEPFAVPEIFVDGFTQHKAHDGVMSCVGYRKLAEGKIVVVRLVWPAVNTSAAIDDAISALSAPAHDDKVIDRKRDCH